MKTDLQTERVIIRRFQPEDLMDLYEYLSDAAVLRYEPYAAMDLAGCQEELAFRCNNADFYAVSLKESGKLIGNLYFSEQDAATYELGYVFNAAYQHQGYASEAATALLNYGFYTLGLHRVLARCNPENTASWRLLERLALRREAHHRKNVFFQKDLTGQPIWQDTYVYAILEEEWFTKHPE